MENKEEIIINVDVKKPKVKKPLSEEQREKQRLNMRNYYLAKKNDPDYIARQRLSRNQEHAGVCVVEPGLTRRSFRGLLVSLTRKSNP